MENEFEEILKESYKSIEDIFSGEDRGWINLSQLSQKAEFTASQKRDIIKRSRFYSSIDPLTVQALRLWSDYSLGSGLIRSTEKLNVDKVLKDFWDARINKPVLSCKGQRQNSYKLLIDGSIYFALFLGAEGKVTIRRIDPLEITEIITDPDDLEDVRYYKRQWLNSQGKAQEGYYRSWQNVKDKSTLDMYGTPRTSNQEAIIYHIEREPDGLPLILPAMDWIKLFRQFLASRVAIILALARFAWKTKVTGGSKAVSRIKTQVDQTKPDAASWIIENMGADTQPIKTDTGASGAYQDGRMLKLQICAAFGITEQYFGDISIGSLATAQTVELPMVKMFSSYQNLWLEAYEDISDIVLEYNEIPEAERIFDFDLPAISPEEAAGIAANIAALIPVIPSLSYSQDVLQQAMMSVGIKDVEKAIAKLGKTTESNPNVALIKALQNFRESLENKKKDK
jgi:hypothetical protein